MADSDAQSYPVSFAVDYPDRDLNRLSTGFRFLTLIPIAIVLCTIGGLNGAGVAISTGGLLFVPPLLMIVFRQRYPRWWFDWNLQMMRFTNRVGIYASLMDDNYPSTTDEQSVWLELPYPDVENDLNRWLPLVKWFLAIPHYLVLVVLHIGATFAVIGAWFMILFTKRYPRGLFNFVEGVLRWHNRVVAYAFLLVTDEYPPFRLKP